VNEQTMIFGINEKMNLGTPLDDKNKSHFFLIKSFEEMK